MPVLRVLVLALLLALPGAAVAQDAAAPADATLVVYVREGCPHCADAKRFLPGFAAARPWLRVLYRDIGADPEARAELVAHSRRAGAWPPGVPTFVYQGRVLVGFGTPEASGPLLAALVGQAPPAPPAVQSGWFGELSVARLGLPLFTLALGLLDGFNPCAMWVLLFLLSMLVHLRDRLRMALIAGTFVLASGAVYYAFMAAWLNAFLVLGISTLLRYLLAALALAIGAINLRDALKPDAGFTLSIPDAAKPGLYARMRAIALAGSLRVALPAVAVLAIVVNFVELLCTAGFPAVYTATLAQQGLSPAAHYAYLGLYIAGYVADDTLMVTLAVLALGTRKLTERAGRMLKLVSGAVMAALGLVLLLRPGWLF